MRVASLLLLPVLAACASCHSEQYTDSLRTSRSVPSDGGSSNETHPKGTNAPGADLDPNTARQARFFLSDALFGARLVSLAALILNEVSQKADKKRKERIYSESKVPAADEVAEDNEKLEDLLKKTEALQSRISATVDSSKAVSGDRESNANAASKDQVVGDLVKLFVKTALQILDKASGDGSGSGKSEGRRTNNHRTARRGRRIDEDSVQAADEG